MSTSMLYHTFGIKAVQYLRTDFLKAKRSFTDRRIQMNYTVRFVKAAT